MVGVLKSSVRLCVCEWLHANSSYSQTGTPSFSVDYSGFLFLSGFAPSVHVLYILTSLSCSLAIFGLYVSLFAFLIHVPFPLCSPPLSSPRSSMLDLNPDPHDPWCSRSKSVLNWLEWKPAVLWMVRTWTLVLHSLFFTQFFYWYVLVYFLNCIVF